MDIAVVNKIQISIEQFCETSYVHCTVCPAPKVECFFCHHVCDLFDPLLSPNPLPSGNVIPVTVVNGAETGVWKEKYKDNLFYCTSLYCTLQVLHSSQIEGKTFHQQNDYFSLYCDTRFIVVVWNQTQNISGGLSVLPFLSCFPMYG